MKGLEIRLKVCCKLTAEQWELYTNGPLAHSAQSVANILNSKFETLVNEGHSKQYVLQEMMKVMDSYADFGARDTEPMSVLQNLINEIYG